MSELAFNINGEAFEVPANATGWRVRRMRAKGSPEVVYGRDGLPLVLAIDAELDDLKAEVTVTGRYRLDLVDQNNKAIADVPSGYVQVNAEAAPVSGGSTASASAPFKPSDNIVIEAMRTQSAMALAVIEKFPLMMDSAATLLRAADGAGLPARPPMAIESVTDDDDDTGDEENEQPPGFDLNALIAQMVPVIIAGFSSGKLKMPDLGSVLDWRRAAKKAQTAPANEPTAKAATTTAIPPLDPAAMAHVVAIQSALDPHEVAYIQEVARELSPAELRGWFDE